MNNLYKKIGIVLGVLLMMSCSKDMLKEDPSFIPENPNPGAEGLPPNEQWAWVVKYPGEVSNLIQRLENVEVKISGNYQPKDLKMTANPKYWQSTGLYVPPVEDVTIVVSGANINYQIGVADVFLPAGEKYQRFEKVSKSGTLQVGENKISSNFGGPLYFYFDGTPSDQTLTVSGAVKMPTFVLGETDYLEWAKITADTINPMIWGELIGKRAILTLPAKTLRQISRPDALLKFYDEIIEKDFNAIAGLTDEDLKTPWRIYSDVQLPNKAVIFPAYPMGYNSITADSMDQAIIGLPNFAGKSNKTVLGGIAGLYGMSWSDGSLLKKSIQQTLSYHLFQRKGIWANLGITMTATKDPTKRYMLPTEADNQSMVLQLLQQYGWGLYSYASKRCREEMPAQLPDRYKNDLYAIYASEYANADLTDFFAAWDFQVSMFAQQYMKQYPAPEPFWKTSNVYKQPPFSSETPAGVAYAKMTPEKDTVYDRSHWTITSTEDDIDEGNGSGFLSCLLDGKTDTYWHTIWWEVEGVVPPYPHNFACMYENGEELEFNYVYFSQRNHANVGAKTFILKVKPTPDPELDDWVEIEGGKEFYLRRDKTTRQYIHLSNSYKGYGVQVVFTAALPSTEGGTSGPNYVGMAEFGTGLLK